MTSFDLKAVPVCLQTNFKSLDVDKCEVFALKELTKQMECSSRKPAVASSGLCSSLNQKLIWL